MLGILARRSNEDCCRFGPTAEYFCSFTSEALERYCKPFPTLVVGCHVILNNRGRSTGTCNIYAVNVMNFSLRLVVAGGVSETNTISAPIAHPLIPCSDVAATLQDT